MNHSNHRHAARDVGPPGAQEGARAGAHMGARQIPQMRARPPELADVTGLLIRAQSGSAREVVAEVDDLLAEARRGHAHDRAQWLRFVRFAAHHELGELARADDAATEMIRLAEPRDDRTWEAFGHALRGMALLLRSRFEPAYDELARAVVLLEEISEPGYAIGHAINAAVLALARLDLYELAVTWLERLRAVSAALSDAMLATLYAYNSGWLELNWACELELIGETDAAGAHYRATLAAFEAAPSGVDAIDRSYWPREVVVQAGAARAMLGAGAEVVQELRAHLDAVAATERQEATIVGYLGLARAHANEGETDQAVECAAQACAVGDTLPRLNVVAVRAYWEYAELLRRVHGPEPTGQAYARLTSRLVRDRWNERRARVTSFDERLTAERLRDELRRRAAAYLTDPLTGLGNRRLIEIRLPELLVESAATGHPLAVAFVDVDDFKSVNDELSHLVGDDLLRELAQEMRAALSPDDAVARFGGEEFVIVLPSRDAEQAFDVVDALRRRIEERVWNCLPHDRRIRITAGLAQSWHGATRTQLLAAADEALLRAKRQGKNRVEVRASPLAGDL
ncbi:GGDEF domain-containing protein [Actinopolymorpha rutila]|uniref:Diguanylate cyclase (GGDEF)-like protein n=1 Tax=Actinopolymorpha rutila TaxID=446787 RepID=A0A852ZGP4_9ACTN|nr:GGDEF domain-containing protein [Actinopolymorpha rutila]NYH91463.1 diguanylate cyclase (GGDEF)-like protein [Actinopolymorpha rutila]